MQMIQWDIFNTRPFGIEDSILNDGIFNHEKLSLFLFQTFEIYLFKIACTCNSVFHLKVGLYQIYSNANLTLLPCFLLTKKTTQPTYNKRVTMHLLRFFRDIFWFHNICVSMTGPFLNGRHNHKRKNIKLRTQISHSNHRSPSFDVDGTFLLA